MAQLAKIGESQVNDITFPGSDDIVSRSDSIVFSTESSELIAIRDVAFTGHSKLDLGGNQSKFIIAHDATIGSIEFPETPSSGNTLNFTLEGDTHLTLPQAIAAGVIRNGGHFECSEGSMLTLIEDQGEQTVTFSEETHIESLGDLNTHFDFG